MKKLKKQKPWKLLNWDPSQGSPLRLGRKPPRVYCSPPRIICASAVRDKKTDARVSREVARAEKEYRVASKKQRRRVRVVRMPKPKKVRGGILFPRVSVPKERWHLELRCDAHLATVAGLKVEQADRIINAWDPGYSFSTSAFRGKRHVMKRVESGGWAMLPPRSLVVRLDYPLKHSVFVKIDPFRLEFRGGHSRPYMSVGYLLWQVARFYRDELYRRWKRHGVWGHCLGDLHFETITIHGAKAEIGIGS